MADKGSQSMRTTAVESTRNTSRNAAAQRDETGHHKVKFWIGAEDEESSDSTSRRKPLPKARRPLQDNTINGLLDTDVSTDVTELSPFRTLDCSDTEQAHTEKEASALSAHDRASKLASRVGSYSAPASRRNSVDESTSSPGGSPSISRKRPGKDVDPVRMDDIPLMDLHKDKYKDKERPYSLHGDSTDDDDENDNDTIESYHTEVHKKTPKREAHRLVRAMTRKINLQESRDHVPGEDRQDPPRYKTGILSSLLKLYDQSGAGAALHRTVSSPSFHEHLEHGQYRPSKEAISHATRSLSDTPTTTSAHSSGKTTPRRAKWYKSPRHSTTSLSQLVPASDISAGAGASGSHRASSRPDFSRRSSTMLSSAVQKIKRPGQSKPGLEEEIEVKVHIAEIIERQRYLIKLCRALMLYGAPTHRLEEYMRTSARVLLINGQFMYLPGCMLVSFDDPGTHTAELKLIKETQGVDLGRFKDVFEIYKNVIHDVTGVNEAMDDLNEVMGRKERYPSWLRVLMYGFASVCVGPFAFGARPSDWPICFGLGCLLGWLQLIVAPNSEEFSHVFEVGAAILISFLARAFGSINVKGQPLFCFSAIAQSSIALILPGYTILCGSLELQSHNIVAGSVRMVYAIIYALFLGFGITIGTALYGVMDRDATSRITCATPSYFEWWTRNVYLSHFPFVPLFAVCLIVINQGRWKQGPVMVGIAFAGYQVNFWSARRFANNVQVANALGAFAIGSLANLYSRLFHGLAAAALLPAIFVQVSSNHDELRPHELPQVIASKPQRFLWKFIRSQAPRPILLLTLFAPGTQRFSGQW